VNRSTAIDIAADEVTGQIDGAPIRLSGTLRGLGTPDLAVDGSAYAKGLDLAHVRKFIPALGDLALAGKLDIDVKVSLPAATAADARLNGSLATAGLSFRLPSHGITVTEGVAELALRGASADILRMHLQVNDQVVAVTGQIANPVKPDIRLVVTSPDLDINRLLPRDNATQPTSSPSPPDSSRHGVTPEKGELPAVARKMTAQLQVLAKQGQYRVLRFHDLRLDASYDRGVLTRWDVDFGVEDGRIAATGTADLRDPERVPFEAHPQITSLKLEAVAPVLGIGQVPLDGPLSLTGHLQGRMGSTKDLLSSLAGSVQAEMEPGTFFRIGRFGETMAKILGLVSARGFLSGRTLSNLSDKGLPYRTITAQTTFDKGHMEVDTFSFLSDSMTLDSRGRIDLLNEQMDMQAKMQALGIVDKTLQVVPLVGRSAADLTAIHLQLTGSLDNPDIRIAVGQRAKDLITDEEKSLRSPLKGITDSLKKSLEQLLGK
jgi:hypothetical protein